jgi:hypothetical protein
MRQVMSGFGWAALVLLGCSACTRLQVYAGPRLSRAEVGVIAGDPTVTAGLPLTAVLRKVDNRVIAWNVTQAEVLPGEHLVLVDCRLGDSTVRFELPVTVVAGYRYQAIATPRPGNHRCAEVTWRESRR